MVENQEDLEATQEADRPKAVRPKKDDPWIDEFLCALPGPLIAVVNNVIARVSEVEQRDRRRKDDVEKRYRLLVEVVVANLAKSYLTHREPKPIVVCRDHKEPLTIYNNHDLLRRTLGKTLDLLQTAGFLLQTEGSSIKGLRSTMRIAPGLMCLIEDHGVDLSCFGRLDGEPLIIVSTKEDRGYHLEPRHPPVDYQPTPETQALSDQVASINDYLGRADIQFLRDGLEPVNSLDRKLTRRFKLLPNQRLRFDQVGRLYGGFWMNLKKYRRGSIRLQGEPIADLDFVSLHPRLAYSRLGRKCPDGDLYDLTGHLDGYDRNNEHHRDAVKQGLCSILNGGRGGRAPGQPSHLDDLPRGTTAKKLREALISKHPGLATIIEPKEQSKEILGYKLMFTESLILLDVFWHLMEMNIVALPSHDGLFVAQSKARITQNVMEFTAQRITGTDLPVKCKSVPEAPQAIVAPLHLEAA
ncbi:hypothetical protein [Methylobacterium sp. P5_C11]